jgi:hypothetical protein
MFDENHRDMEITLRQMQRNALAKSQANQSEAKQVMAKWITNDSRFAGFDAQKLTEAAHEQWAHGAQLDLDDPALKRGGQPRPIPLRGSRY